MNAQQNNLGATATQSPVVESVRMIETPDDFPDASWLEQEGWEDRLAQYRNGDFYFVGIQAQAEISIPHGNDGTCILQTITSPGLWGIESDSGSDYFESVYQDEKVVLRDMLQQLGIKDATL